MKKKRFFRILCSILICIFGFVFVGCGNDPDYSSSLKDRYENGEISFEEYQQQRFEAMSVPLYGTKVLYRPDHYDWEGNVGAENKDYYGQYSWNIMKYLSAFYGVVDQQDPVINTLNQDKETAYPNLPAEQTDDQKLSGLYDSIRYQMQSYNTITLQKVDISEKSKVDAFKLDPTQEYTKLGNDVNYLEVTANPNNAWNWSFNPDTTTSKSYIYRNNYDYLYYRSLSFNAKDTSSSTGLSNFRLPYNTAQSNNDVISNSTGIKNNEGDNELSLYLENIESIYSISSYKNNYAQDYLNTMYSYEDTEDASSKEQLISALAKSSDYVKALEYAIYCINLDLQPNEVRVTYSNGVPVVSIDAYPAADGKSSAQVALDSIKVVFEKIGTYVGLSQRHQIRLKNWILRNIIGENSQSQFSINRDKYTYIQFVTQAPVADTNGDGTIGDDDDKVEVICDENGNTVSEPTFVKIRTGEEQAIDVNRDYDTNLDAILEICKTQVNIGISEGEGQDAPSIDDRYVASNIVDYFGNDFFVSGNNDFPGEALEYQSVALMFRQDFQFSNIMLFFKYDAGMDGDGIYDPNNSITINVYLNLYNKETNTRKRICIIQDGQTIDTFPIQVNDGPFSYGAKENTLMLFGLKDIRPEGNFGITCSAFNPEIGNGILASITDGYSGLQSIGTPLPLSGLNNRRNYYQLVEPSGDSESNTYYSYGVLNPDMFSGADGCDYVEIAYEVIKTTGDYSTNYKFYTGIGLVA